MRDSDHQEENLAVDYALDMLEPDRKRAFLERLDRDPDLGREVRRLEGTVSNMTLAVPQLNPDSGNLEAILRRVSNFEDSGLAQDDVAGSSTEPSPPQKRFRFLMWSGWSMAACFAMIAAWLVVNDAQHRTAPARLESGNPVAGTGIVGTMSGDDRQELHQQTAKAENGFDAADESDENPEQERVSLAENLDSDGDQPGPPLLSGHGNEWETQRLKRSLEQLQQQLSVMGKAHSDRFQAVPGLSRLVIIEMHAQRPPNSDPAGAEKTGPDTGPNPVPDSPLDEDRPEGLSVASIAASAVEDGLTALGPIPPLFDQKEPESILAQPRNVPNENAPAVRSPDELTAFALYDETTGEGSILVHNLPSPEDNHTYQLWMVDSLNGNPVSVGLLPVPETGTDPVFFKMENALSPSEFFITNEPDGGSPRPTGELLLSGPDR